MNKEKAWEALQQGYHVTEISWDDEEYVYMDAGGWIRGETDGIVAKSYDEWMEFPITGSEFRKIGITEENTLPNSLIINGVEYVKKESE